MSLYPIVSSYGVMELYPSKQASVEFVYKFYDFHWKKYMLIYANKEGIKKKNNLQQSTLIKVKTSDIRLSYSKFLSYPVAAGFKILFPFM